MRLRLSLFAALLATLVAAAQAAAAIPVYDAKPVRVFPHDPTAFTEGLFYLNGDLYESVGLTGRSAIRRVDLATGKVLRSRALPTDFFGEGIVPWRGRIVQLTWRRQLGFVYDLKTFDLLKTFSYPGEGWALTTDGRRLIMSDGTPRLRFLDPTTLRQTGSLLVTADGVPVKNLNELEWVNGEIFANVWLTDRIARIDPKSGDVVGWIDVTDLVDPRWAAADRDAVPNGIAYDAAGNRLFVTGKLWPK
ncbi:MAG: glutaminyl-peptide cyclotransferase, partial [Caulobacteraceae bacterium]